MQRRRRSFLRCRSLSHDLPAQYGSSRQVALSDFLVDPLKYDAIYQFLISGNLHALEKIMGEHQPCLVGGSGND
jgi:hypothetical protein